MPEQSFREKLEALLEETNTHIQEKNRTSVYPETLYGQAEFMAGASAALRLAADEIDAYDAHMIDTFKQPLYTEIEHIQKVLLPELEKIRETSEGRSSLLRRLAAEVSDGR